MLQEKRQLCRACALGDNKLSHNGDPYSCINGREELIKYLPAKEQLVQLLIHERLSHDMLEYIEALAKERNKTPIEIIREEGLNLLENI